MELIPAIDLLGGKVVRLLEGDYEKVTVYAEDPVEEALRFQAAGATRLHIVDLDGARGRGTPHFETIARIVKASSMQVQGGGGIRNLEVARRWLDAGVHRVVVGTAVVREPAWVEALAGAEPGRVIAALDAKDGEVRVDGWLDGSGQRATDVAQRCDAWGVDAILFTDIRRDGTGLGPSVESTMELQSLVKCTVIASGGIGSIEHVLGLARAGARATVCGRALYDGSFTYEQAMSALRGVL